MNITQLQAERARIDALIEAASTPSIINFPASRVVLSAGEVYCGIMLSEGGLAYHLILVPEATEALTWEQGMEWASSLCASMPTSKEWSLIMSNASSAISDGCYWSSTENSATSAWRMFSTSGLPGVQYSNNKNNARNVRAVRKVSI